MIEYFKSVNNKYTYDNDKYLKNETPLIDEDGNSINDASFKLLIKKETSHFIHKNYGNIIVLAGAGASVVLNGNNICVKFGKTVSMLAELINKELKTDSNCFTLQELADFCKYNVLVEEVEDGKINPKFNLEDFLSNMLSFEKYVAESDYPKYEVSKNKIFDLIISNTSYDYDASYLKHSAFINTVSQVNY